MHLARIALTGVSVFCSSIFLPPFKFHFNPIPALLASLFVEPPPVSLWAWPQVRKHVNGLQQCLFRLVPCGLRAWQRKATTDFHLKPQNRICCPSRHTSPDVMQPVKVQFLSLVWIRHTELPVPRCRNKISLVPGSVIPPLVFCLA